MKNPNPHEPWLSFESRQRKPELKREMLLKTAAHLFLERGFRKTSMNDIAKLLRVSKPALYHYFRNKEEILIGCCENGIALMNSVLRGLDPSDGSGLEKLRTYVHSYAEVIVTAEFGKCVATLNDSDLGPESRVKVKRLKRRIDSTMRRFIEEGVADGSIKPCNCKLASFAIAGAVNGIGIWYNPAGTLSPNEIIESFTDLLISGLESKSAGNQRPKKKTVKASPRRHSRAK